MEWIWIWTWIWTWKWTRTRKIGWYTKLSKLEIFMQCSSPFYGEHFIRNYCRMKKKLRNEIEFLHTFHIITFSSSQNVDSVDHLIYFTVEMTGFLSKERRKKRATWNGIWFCVVLYAATLKRFLFYQRWMWRWTFALCFPFYLYTC